MTMQDEQHSWFTFSVQDTGGTGVEVAKLAKLLEDISSTFYAIARAKIGVGGPRPGPRSIAEEALADVRLVRVSPGSITIELEPPPAASQAQLPILEEPTADDVALEFYEEVRRIEADSQPPEGRWDIRRRVRTVIEDAAEIGATAEIVYRPVARRPTFPAGDVLKATIQTRRMPSEKPPERSRRIRRISGHAYMVDVEPGRQRIRIKLPDGRDATLDADEELTSRIRNALDRIVEIVVEEELEGDVTISRIAQSVEVLPSSGPGSDQPPKSIEELEQEQSLPKERPDYAALASAIWRTEEDIEKFEEHVRQIRQAETA